MRKKFTFEFDDSSPNRSITFEYDDSIEEKMAVTIEDGIPVVYANRQALMLLAKTFIKMSIGSYTPGFHLHFTEDFEVGQPEAIRVILVQDE